MPVPLVPAAPDPTDAVRVLEGVWERGAAALLLPAARSVASSPPLPTAVAAALDGARGLPDDSAVVVLTSGSTGSPRGVVLGHAALAAAVDGTIARLGCVAGERFALALPVHHVAGLMVVLRARALGTPPIVVERAGDPDALLASAAGGATHLSLVPTQLARLVATGARLDGFRTLLVGGGPAPADLLDAARAAGGRVVTSYGMTETCGGCVHDGVPLPGVEVAIDAAGRIRLRGPVLASGYLGAADDAFEPDGWFATPDRGRLEGGRLVVEGRLDDVVVSGGTKVAPSAVVAALLTHPGIDDALVLGIADAEWGERVRAVVVPRARADPPTLEKLRDHVRTSLPASHAPTELVLVDALGRDGLGKVTDVERRRLAALPPDERSG